MELTWLDFLGIWFLVCAAAYALAVVGMTVTDWISRRLGWL